MEVWCLFYLTWLVGKAVERGGIDCVEDMSAAAAYIVLLLLYGLCLLADRAVMAICR